MEYTNGTKATWRYWAWKRLRESIRTQAGLATVLFLSGPSPEDLAAATKNGFKVRNIVAVDIDPDAVKAARKAGCVAIEGDIHDVVTFWNDGEIHGVLADYCYGMTYEQFQRSRSLLGFVNGPVCLNFQRGREASLMTTEMRKVFKKHEVPISRADQFIFMLAATNWHFSEYGACGELDAQDLLRDIMDCDAQTIKEFKDRLHQLLEPQFMSYRSNVVVMDSVVLRGSFKSATSRKLKTLGKDLLSQDKDLIDSTKEIVKRINALSRELDSLGGPETEEELRLANRIKENLKYILGKNRSVNGQQKVISRLIASKAIRTMNGAAKLQSGSN